MINDETLQLLSAYLDGALPESERSALEARLAASPDLRRELEELRAVSNAVKELPKEPLPPGFIARLQARRARGDTPTQVWVFLPPAARPLVAAMSVGVVALTIWNKVVVEEPLAVIHPQVAAKIEEAGDAPVSRFNVSARAAGGSSSEMDSLGSSAGLGVANPVGEEVRRGDVLPKLDELASGAPAAAPAAAIPASPAAVLQAGARAPARAKGHPYGVGEARGAGAGGELRLRDRTRSTMTEEERSARNEEMFGFIEKEKKKMGIAKVLPRDGLASAARGAGLSGLDDAQPPLPAINAPAPTMLKKAAREGPAAADAVLKTRGAVSGRLAPGAGLVFSEARGLASSWVLLGFPGNPPAVDFSAGRLVLIKPSGTKIVSVTAGPDAVRVVYRTLDEDEESSPAKDRVAPIPPEPKTVLIFDASPR